VSLSVAASSRASTWRGPLSVPLRTPAGRAVVNPHLRRAAASHQNEPRRVPRPWCLPSATRSCPIASAGDHPVNGHSARRPAGGDSQFSGASSHDILIPPRTGVQGSGLTLRLRESAERTRPSARPIGPRLIPRPSGWSCRYRSAFASSSASLRCASSRSTAVGRGGGTKDTAIHPRGYSACNGVPLRTAAATTVVDPFGSRRASGC
jgi:hypothetical protein